MTIRLTTPLTITLTDATTGESRIVDESAHLRVIARDSRAGDALPGAIETPADRDEVVTMSAGALAEEIASVAYYDRRGRERAPRSHSGHGRAWYVYDAGQGAYWRTTAERTPFDAETVPRLVRVRHHTRTADGRYATVIETGVIDSGREMDRVRYEDGREELVHRDLISELR